MGPAPALIARYRRTHSQVSVLLNEMSPAAQIEELRGHRIDLSISRTRVDDEELQSQPLWPDPVAVALPAGHRLAGRKRLALADLAREPFVVRQDTSAYARWLAEACAREGFMPDVAQSVAEVPAAGAGGGGLGVALAPESACRQMEGRIAVCALPAALSQAMVYAVTRRQDAAARWTVSCRPPRRAARATGLAEHAVQPAARPAGRGRRAARRGGTRGS